jgi:hypothetical protein
LIVVTKPVFCSPLKGVIARAEVAPGTRCSSLGALNQKSTLQVWIQLRTTSNNPLKPRDTGVPYDADVRKKAVV